MLTLKDIADLEKEFKEDGGLIHHDVITDLLVLSKRSLLFQGILGNLKQVLESPCTHYGAEEQGNRCCFKFMMYRNNPCPTCSARANLGYPCPACNKSHAE